MNILFINGSPIHNGVIDHVFDLMEKRFDAHCVRVDIPNDIKNCINCRKCKDHSLECDPFITTTIDHIREADAIILGSPVYYGGITSQMKSFLTKLFYSHPKECHHKPIGLVVSSRRAGSIMALSEFALPFLMHSNIIVGSTYWNEIHGDNPDESDFDYEGLQTIDNLVDNIAYVASGLSSIKKPEISGIRHLNYISREYIAMASEKTENK